MQVPIIKSVSFFVDGVADTVGPNLTKLHFEKENVNIDFENIKIYMEIIDRLSNILLFYYF